MLNYIWAFMILFGIIYSLITGNLHEMTNGGIQAGKEAVELCVTMAGVLGFWMGFMEVAEKAGVIKQLSKLFSPIVKFLFPNVPENSKAKEYICTNMVANFLGLGWAATPPGLKAMEELKGEQENTEKKSDNINYNSLRGRGHIASDEMCTLLVVNISSLQLIPINMIAYRSQYGSTNPTAIVAPAIIATGVSTVAAIIFCKAMCGRSKKRQ